MQNLTLVFEKSKNVLRSLIDDEVETCEINDSVGDTYPFEYFMQIPNRMKMHKFYEDIKVGDVVFGSISRVFTTKLEICLLCTMGTIIRDIYNLRIPATCSPNELPICSNFSSVHSFRRGDIVKTIVISVTRNEYIELSMNKLNKANKFQHEDLGLCSSEKLPTYYSKLKDYSDPPRFFYDLFESQSLKNSLELRDKLKSWGLKTTNFSLLDVVNKIEIKPDETAKSLRSALLMKESKKFVVKGVEYYKQRKYNEALQCYNHALSIDESNVDALVARGALRATLKAFELSIADLEKAVKIEPNHKNASVYLSKTIIAYSKSLPEAEINKAEMLVKKQILLENELREHSKLDISNPNNFIVLSDEELSICSKPVSSKSKHQKKKKNKKQKKSSRKKRISYDLTSNDRSNDSDSSKSLSPENKKRKRKSSFSTSNSREKCKYQYIDLDNSGDNSPPEKRRPSFNNYSHHINKIHKSHSISVNDEARYTDGRDRLSDLQFVSDYDKEWRRSVADNNFMHKPSHFDDKRENAAASRDTSKEIWFKRQSNYYSQCYISNRKEYNHHWSFEDRYRSSWTSLDESVTQVPNQPNEDNPSVEENPKLKAADEEIRKIEEFISQLKNNLKE